MSFQAWLCYFLSNIVNGDARETQLRQIELYNHKIHTSAILHDSFIMESRYKLNPDLAIFSRVKLKSINLHQNIRNLEFFLNPMTEQVKMVFEAS